MIKYDKDNIESRVRSFVIDSEFNYDLEERIKVLLNVIHSERFIEAIKLCIDNNLCNTLILQRHFSISYSSALAIMDSMEALDLITVWNPDDPANRKPLPEAEEFVLYWSTQGKAN